METTTASPSDPSLPTLPTVVLVPGHWLGAWAWEAVAADLEGRGYAVVPVTLPGLDPDDPARTSATIDQQADALGEIVRVASTEVDGGGGPVVLVAHSGAGTPVSVLLDRDPSLVTRVVYVDSGPTGDGAVFDPEAPTDLVEMALPSFDDLAEGGASLEGLDDAVLARFRKRAVPEPGPIVTGTTALGNDARRDVPVTIVCSSFPSAVMMEMARGGHPMMAEVATLRDLELVDLPTGHWPMWSRPVDLAEVIATAAGR